MALLEEIHAFARKSLPEATYTVAAYQRRGDPFWEAYSLVMAVIQKRYDNETYRQMMGATLKNKSVSDLVAIVRHMAIDNYGNILKNIKDNTTRSYIEFMLEQTPEIAELFKDLLSSTVPLGHSSPYSSSHHTSSHHKNDLATIALDGEYYLVYGQCQCGKTTFIQCAGMSHILLNGCASINILQNSKGSAKQLEERSLEFINAQQDYVRSKGYSVKDPIKYVYVGGASVEKLAKALQERAFIVAIANDTQLSKIASAIKSIANPKYVLCIDEADEVVHGADKGAAFRKHLPLLESKAGRVYAVTATTFDVLFSEERIRSANVVVKEPKSIYKGLNAVKMYLLEDENATPATKKNGWFDNDRNLLPWLYNQSTKNIYNQDYTPYAENHPLIALINSTHMNEQQYALFQHIAKDDPKLRDIWGAVVYNNNGFYVYHPSLKGVTALTIGKRKAVKVFPGAFLVKNASLKQVFDYFYTLGNKVSHVAVIAGDMARRGISFTNFKWHLSHMYYIPSAGSSVAHKIQAVGRMCGNFDDSVPLYLFSHKNVLEDIVNGKTIQEEAIERAKRQQGFLSKNVKALTFNSVKVPKQKLGYQVSTEFTNVVQGDDGGRPVDEYKKLLGEIRKASSEYAIPTGEFYKIDPPTMGTRARDLYDKITNHLSHPSLIGTWIELTDLRKVFPVQMNLHDKKRDSSAALHEPDLPGFKGLAYRQLRGSNTSIEYRYQQ